MRNVHQTDEQLSETLRDVFALSQEQEDALWSRFQARQRESMQWAAFAATMVLVNARMRPVRRAALWWCAPQEG